MAKKKAVITPEYDAIRPKLDTGDIVLFSGKGAFSEGIKWFSKSTWSHVGMVVHMPDWGHFLWESTTLSDLEDFETGTLTKGVQLVVLSDRIKKYEGEIAIRRLQVERTERMTTDLAKLRLELRGKPYEKIKLELIRAVYDGPFGQNTADLSSLFCSELVAQAYQTLGLLSEDLPANEYVPKDFSTERAQPLELLLDAELTNEVKVKKEVA